MLEMVLALAAHLQISETVNGAASLYRNCQASVRVMNGTAKADDSGDSNLCVGYIQGFVESADLKGGGICLPNGFTTGTAIRIYIAYMDKDPKRFDQPRWVGLALSFADSYPCPVK